eukprot:CAMPEP_0196676380 /NCGR_PEP_ID=MMETSP1090-20130531/4825_1 /TAXON_ID=37098 /ORGANISM="Isochrysis sp, Strain CCMP1244" /LENGTH=231 /DNA_ID=CAMNT_0042014343 /DNA_START=129 /DNA_END=821 /DNA_ORIENTATION=-
MHKARAQHALPPPPNPSPRPTSPRLAPAGVILEQEAQVVLRELRERADVSADGALEDEPLLVLQANDALLHGVAHDKPNRADGLVLAEAVGAVDGLVLGGRVPPRVHQVDVGRDGQVEGDAARLEGDEDHLCAEVVLEGVEYPLARRDAHPAVELDHLDARALDPVLEQVEERDELRKDDRLGRRVSLAHRVQLLHQRLHLRARAELGHVQPAEDALEPHAAAAAAAAAAA